MENRASLLFVYGTLLTGTANPALDRLVKRCLVPIGAATTPGSLYRLGGYPAAIPDPHCASLIHGVVVRVRHPWLCWPRLDRYEDCGRLYTRERVTAFLGPSGARVTCWMYHFQGGVRHRQRIRGGDFPAFRRRLGS